MEYETSEPKTSTFDLYSKGVSSVEQKLTYLIVNIIHL